MELIDRERLLSERMKSMYYHLPNGDIAVPLIDIEHAPVVDAVPVVHGRWIYEERDRLDHETDDGRVFRTEKWWKCSECGNAKGYIGHKPSDKFCSKCGADMREDGETHD